MRNVIGSFLKGKDRENWFELFLYLFVVSLPMGHGADAVMLAPMLLCYLLILNWKEKRENLKANWTSLLLLFSIPILLVVGLFYSDNVHVALGRVERSLPLFVLPVIIFSLPKRLIKIKNILYALGIGLLAVILLSWGAIIADILSKASPLKQAKYFFEWIYTDRNLLRDADMHPSYFAIILVLFLSAVMNGRILIEIRSNAMLSSAVVFASLLFLVETSSRVGFASLVFILTFSFFDKGKTKYRWAQLVIFLVLIITVLKFDYLSSKLLSLVDIEGNVTFERYFRWKEILNVNGKKGNWLFGVGTGDIYYIFDQAYKNGGFKLASSENYNAHNQYLELLVGNGLIGLFIYLWCLLNFVFKTKLKGISMPFMVLIVLFSFSESFLVRSKGVMFFSFFYPLLISYYRDKDE